MRGTETRETKNEVECPICFLYFDQLNATQCCKAFICTECFLQLNPPPRRKHEHPSRHRSRAGQASCDCPFCNSPKLVVQVSANDMNVLKNAEREEEEQKIIEAKIRADLEERSASLQSKENAAESSNAASSAFGESLVKHSSTRKLTGDGSFEDGEIYVASVEERATLEEEMKQQHLHPLVRQMQQEAEEASNARAQEYLMSNRGRRSRLRERYNEARSALLSSGRHEVSSFLWYRSSWARIVSHVISISRCY